MARTEEEINDLLNKCAEAEDTGESKYPGMTYEPGHEGDENYVQAAPDHDPEAVGETEKEDKQTE